MKINSLLTEKNSPQRSWLRLARRVIAAGALAVGMSSVWAQVATSTLAGTPLASGTTDNTGALARFSTPIGVAVDSGNGFLYVADSANHTIRKVVISTGAVSTFAGAAGTSGATNAPAGPATTARFNSPSGLALDGAGNLYVADTGNHLVRKIVISSGVVSTVAGAGTLGYVNNTGALAKFFNPFGIATDRAGGASNGAAVNIFVTETGNHTVRQIVEATGVVTTLAGGGGAVPPASNSGSTNATGAAASFNSPKGIAVDYAGTTVYVADTNNNLIRKITVATGVVGPFAGSGTAGGTDANGVSATFNLPYGLTLDSTAANLFVADTAGQTIRQIVVAGLQPVTTIAGTYSASGSADGVGSVARFNSPQGIAVGSTGILYLADTTNQTIRVGGPTASTAISGGGQPANTTVLAGNNATFTVTATGNPAVTYQWQINPAVTNGTYTAGSFQNLSNSGAYSGVTTATLTVTAVTAAMNQDQFKCVVSNTIPSSVTSSAATLTVQQAPAITSANNTTFVLNAAGTFTVTATGLPAPSYSITGGNFPAFASLNTTSGVISGTPLAAGGPYVFTITAGPPTNTVGTAATQSFTLTVVTQLAPQITVPASNSTVSAGQNATFTVTATGTPAVSYQWQQSTNGGSSWNALSNGAITGGTVSGATTNTLSILGVTTALNTTQYRVVVSNGVGTAATSSGYLLTVNSIPVITNSTTSFSLTAGQTFPTLTIATSGLPTPASYAISSGALPAWATLNANGTITANRATAAGDAGTSIFSVTATNTVGTSTPVQFSTTVTTGPSVTGPVSLSITPGATAQFSVSATASSGTLSYLWYRATASNPGVFSQALPDNFIYFVASSGGTSTLTVSPSYTTLSMNGDQFRVLVTDSLGSVYSATATLTILQAPAFTSLPSAAFVDGQAGTTFLVQATGSPAPTLSIAVGTLPSWASFTPSSGINTTTGTISGTPSNAVGATSLTFAASNTAGTVYQSFTLNVLPVAATPAFTTQPISQSVTTGQAATFTVVATGSPVPTLQWQRQAAGTTGFVNLTDGSNYSGSTTASLVVIGVSTGMNGDQFQCVATNTLGSATSSAAALTASVSGGTTVTTFAGQALIAGGLDATGTAATFNGPAAIAIDSSGNTYVADTVSSTIRKITSAGVVTTYAGVAGAAGSVDGPASTARFNGPYGVAVDVSGNVYVADTFNQTIRMITPAGTVSTLAGLAGTFGSTDGTGSAARFTYPTGVAVTPSGIIYVADSYNHTIRSIAPGGVVTTYAGAAGVRGSADGFANVGGSAGSARFANPNSVAVDSAGNVYVADSFNHTIRVISAVGNVTTLAGLAGTLGSVDGTGTAARFNQPSGLVVDASGTVYVADTFNNVIRKIASGGVVTTIAGLAGSIGSTDGAGNVARFYQPYGITVDGSGNLFVADTHNDTIRRIGSVTATAPTITTQPQNKSVIPGATATFTVAASGSPAPNYQWRRQPFGISGFTNLVNDGVYYSGVNTATLTVTGVTSAMNGDQFQCVVSNFVSPDAVSSVVTLGAVLVAPTFTSASQVTFTTGQAGGFQVAATGTPAPSFSASGLPFWATLDSTTGVLGGTPPDASGSPFAVTLTANNGATATQSFTLTVVLPVTSPVITTQPASVTLNRGQTATFTVAADGTAPLSYQWKKNSVAISGATSATLTLSGVEPANAGLYTVTVTNSVGSATSSLAQLSVNAPPSITLQPRTQAIIAGSSTTFGVNATGTPAPSYQWRFNGVAIAGATGATLTVSTAGNYDVIVSNSLGQVSSSLAQLIVSSAASAPVITSQPASPTVLLGGSTALTVSAYGAPAPTYQWFKNGALVFGATGSTLPLNNAQFSDTATYTVTITNSVGTVTTANANVRVIGRSYAGVYFGTFGGSLGNFALYVRDDNTAVFLGYLPGSNLAITNRNTGVGDTGAFSFTSGGSTVTGQIGSGDVITGTLSSVAGATLAGTKAADVGVAQPYVGYYQAGGVNSSGTAFAIVSAAGQAFVATQTATLVDGGTGLIDNTGRIALATTKQSIIATVVADTSVLSVTAISGSTVTAFSGAGEAVIAAQRLGNISTRARVDSGANIAIAGFVILGQDSKPVLIRAIGPTLASFGVTGALAAPKLDLFRSGTSAAIATNTGWTTAGNTAAIVAATAQAGGFALGANSADSVIFTTLPPGNYTAQVSAASGAPGVALIEVYDLSAAAPGQKLFNISTRATAGAGDNTLIAGISVNGSVPKRVLIRAVGPGLVQFGLTGVLAQPQLQLINNGTVVAQNTGISTSPDASAIIAASAQVGAFPLPAGSADSALLVSLAPGNYSATVTGTGGATGIAIIEVYEVP